MNERHIYIYGEIQEGDEEFNILSTLENVKNQLHGTSTSDKLIFHNNTPGGDVDEGFKVYDFIKGLPNETHTIIESMSASMGSIIAAATDTREVVTGGKLLVHNPYAGLEGDADFLQSMSSLLRANMDRMVGIYKGVFNLPEEEIREAMKKETIYTHDELLKNGFVSNVLPELKAVAKYNLNKKSNINNMTEKEYDALAEKKLPGLVSKVLAKLGYKPKALKEITDVSGVILVFPDVAEDVAPVVGDAATVDGAAAEGDYTLENGTVYTFAAGALTAITEAEGDDMEALKTENEALKNEIETLKASAVTEKAEIEAKVTEQIEALKVENAKEITAFKASIKSKFTPSETGKKKETANGEEKRSLFKSKD